MALLTNINGKFSVSDAGAVTFNNAFTFPTADGTANYILKTNGSGQLAWAADNYENYDYWILQGDSAANTNINSTNTLKFVGGTYIDTSATWAGGSNPRKLTINHETTSRTDTTSTDEPAFGGTFEAVTSITTNTTGHVTAIDVSTVTIPSDSGFVTGSGTLNKVARWTADGSDIGDGPITFSAATATANSTFGGDVYATGTSNSFVVISRDNMFVDAGQFYLGADDGITDDSYRMYATSGQFVLASRKSGTWTTYFDINSSGNSTFAGDVNLPANKYILIGTDSGDAFNAASAIRVQDTSHAYVQMKVGDSSQGGFLIGNTTDDYLGGFTYSNSSESLIFKTANTDALTITGAGNATFAGSVGVGTSSASSFYPGTNNLVAGSGGGESAISVYSATTSTGYLLFADGTSGSDRYRGQVRYDHNTDSMEFAVNGISTSKLTIDSSGNGTFTGQVNATRFILPSTGTTTPANQYLFTDNTNTGTGSLIIQSGGGSAAYGGGIRLFSHSHASKPGWVTAGISSGSGGKFTVNSQGLAGGTDVFTVDASGNVGIGTASPSQKLHLYNGTLLIDSDAGISTGIWMPDVNGNPSLRVVTDQSTASNSSIVNAWGNSSNAGVMLGTTRNDGTAFQIRSGVTLTSGFANDTGSTRMIVLGNGNVGIGTTSPGSKLQVQGAVFANGEGNGFMVESGTAATARTGFMKYGGLEGMIVSGNSTKIRLGHRTDSDYVFGASPTIREDLVIDAAGNVGIGTTSPDEKLVIDGTSTGNAQIAINNSANLQAVLTLRSAGVDKWYVGRGDSDVLSDSTFFIGNYAGSANNAGGSSAKLVIDSTGNVGIGTTSPQHKLDVRGSGTILQIKNTDATTVDAVAQILTQSGSAQGLAFVTNQASTSWGGASSYNFYTNVGPIAFFTAGNSTSSRLFIEAGGEVGVNNSIPSATLHLTALSSNGVPFKLQGHASTTTNQMLIYTTKIPSTSWYYLVGQSVSAAGNQIIIYGNGNIQNANNSYGQISDIRLKENIVNATPKLEDIKKLKVKNFNFIGDDLKQIGLIAQEVEEVFPGLIDEDKQPDIEDGPEGEVYKSVKYSVLVPMLVKAMQEQQEIIENLKTRIEQLEN